MADEKPHPQPLGEVREAVEQLIDALKAAELDLVFAHGKTTMTSLPVVRTALSRARSYVTQIQSTPRDCLSHEQR